MWVHLCTWVCSVLPMYRVFLFLLMVRVKRKKDVGNPAVDDLRPHSAARVVLTVRVASPPRWCSTELLRKHCWRSSVTS